ncbi:hypothetical protein ACH4XT_16445 [Streptomyces avidinii]|uniref:hypothetical protein n=1 Tax=Streptomyces avidinii TaxID=1895 RepID=UPI0037A9D6D2
MFEIRVWRPAVLVVGEQPEHAEQNLALRGVFAARAATARRAAARSAGADADGTAGSVDPGKVTR